MTHQSLPPPIVQANKPQKPIKIPQKRAKELSATESRSENLPLSVLEVNHATRLVAEAVASQKTIEPVG